MSETEKSKTESIVDSIGIADWGTGFSVVRCTDFKHIVKQILLRGPQTTERKKTSAKWVVIERWITNGEAETKRTRTAQTECEAKQVAQKWADENAAPRKAVEQALRNREIKQKDRLKQMPPPHCTRVTAVDLEDIENARMEVLRDKYPECFKIFDIRETDTGQSQNQLHERLKMAWLEDVAAITGHVPGSPRIELSDEVIEKLHGARSRNRKRKRANRLLSVDYLLALKWEGNYCYLTAKELASQINSTLGTNLSPDAIKKRRARLDLTTKRRPGPDEKS